MLAVLLFSMLVSSSEANEKDVVDSWTRLRISRETLGDLDFQDVRISLYNDSGNSRLTDPSTHKFYFSPMVRLDHHSAKSIFNNYTKEAQMQFNIEMWNEELRNKSFYHLREEENLSHVKLSKIGVLPLERVIMTSASPLVDGYVLPRTWTPYRSTKALKFYFTCDSTQSCDQLAHAMKSSPGQFTDLTLKFSLESERAKTRETIIRVSNVREGELFSKLDQRFPQADSALVTADDRKKILSETSQRILVETFDNDEIFGSVAQQNIMRILENLIFSGREVLQQQSSAMWESVFWEKDNYRPDKAVNTVNELYSNSAKDTQDKLRQFFSSSGANSEEIKRLISSSQSSNSRDSQSNYLSKDTSSSSQKGGHVGFGIGSFSVSGGYSQANEDRAAQATSNSSTKERENTNSKHVETGDTRSNEFMLSTEFNKDELLKLLEESRQNIQWSGERFVTKPLELSRINLAKIRSGQDFTDRATSVKYWTAILSTPVHVDEIYTPSVLNQAREELEQLKRTTLEQIAANRQEQKQQSSIQEGVIAAVRQEQKQKVADFRQELKRLIADIRQEQNRQSSTHQELLVAIQKEQANQTAAIQQEQKQQIADIRQHQTQSENKLVAISNQLPELNQKVTRLVSGLETLRREVLDPVKKKLTRLEGEIKDLRSECPVILAQNVPCYRVGPTCYCFSYGQAPWAIADQICRSNPKLPNGSLLSIETREENDIILEKINTIPGLRLNNEIGFWTSGTDSTSERTWYWSSNGNRFNFTNWSPGQPDNVREQDCMMLYKPYGYRWDDGQCNIAAPFICEAPAPA